MSDDSFEADGSGENQRRGKLFGWLCVMFATAAALWFRVRVFVQPNLYKVCHGDFRLIPLLEVRHCAWNFATYVIAISLAVPALAPGLAVLLQMPINVNEANAQPWYLVT